MKGEKKFKLNAQNFNQKKRGQSAKHHTQIHNSLPQEQKRPCLQAKRVTNNQERNAKASSIENVQINVDNFSSSGE